MFMSPRNWRMDLEMLFGQISGGGHDARLETIIEGDKHGHQRYECLARSHVALQQSFIWRPYTCLCVSRASRVSVHR
jgi:hypothetical protein